MCIIGKRNHKAKKVGELWFRKLFLSYCFLPRYNNIFCDLVNCFLVFFFKPQQSQCWSHELVCSKTFVSHKLLFLLPFYHENVLNNIQFSWVCQVIPTWAIHPSSGTVLLFHIQLFYQMEWSVLFSFDLFIRSRESCTFTAIYFIPRLKAISLIPQGKYMPVI